MLKENANFTDKQNARIEEVHNIVYQTCRSLTEGDLPKGQGYIQDIAKCAAICLAAYCNKDFYYPHIDENSEVQDFYNPKHKIITSAYSDVVFVIDDEADTNDECYEDIEFGEEFTSEQESRIDTVENTVYEMCRNLVGDDLPWDMEYIGDIADCIVESLAECGVKVYYPYYDENGVIHDFYKSEFMKLTEMLTEANIPFEKKHFERTESDFSIEGDALRGPNFTHSKWSIACNTRSYGYNKGLLEYWSLRMKDDPIGYLTAQKAFNIIKKVVS